MAKLPLDIERLALIGWRLIPTTIERTGFFEGYIDQATCDLDQLERWAWAHPLCNWSVIPERSYIWALDIDIPGPGHAGANDGVASLKSLVQAHGRLPSRPHGRSGGGGHLLVFADTGHPIKTRSNFPLPGLDPRARRCGFTVAPSVHRCGNLYRWQTAPWELAAPPAPKWLLDAVKPPPEPIRPPRPEVVTTDRAMRRLRYAVDAVMGAGDGSRNDTLNRQCFAVARHVAAGMLGEAYAIDCLYGAAKAIGLEHGEIKATIRSGFRNGMRHPVEARP